jgi:hypothetical protein
MPEYQPQAVPGIGSLVRYAPDFLSTFETLADCDPEESRKQQTRVSLHGRVVGNATVDLGANQRAVNLAVVTWRGWDTPAVALVTGKRSVYDLVHPDNLVAYWTPQGEPRGDTMSEKDPTCEERIDQQLAGRLDDLRVLQRAVAGEYEKHDDEKLRALGLEDDASEDDAQELIDNLPLDISGNDDDEDHGWYLTVLLSTGGPHDEFRLYPTANGQNVAQATYVFKDWYDHAERTLAGDDLATVVDTWGETMVFLWDAYIRSTYRNQAGGFAQYA